MNIGIDIDGTLNNLELVLAHRAIDFCAVSGLPTFVLRPDAYDIGEMFGWDKDTTTQFYTENLEAALVTAVPMLHAPVVLRLLHAQGHKLHIITARAEEYRKLTLDWFAKYNMPYTSINMGIHNKLEKAQELNINICIEDKPESVVELSTGGFPVIMPLHKYNCGLWGHNITPVSLHWAFIYGAIAIYARHK